MKIGLVSVSFRQNGVEEILKACKDCGISAIEWGSDVHAPANNIEKLNEIARLQKEYNIHCASYGTYFRVCVNDIGEIYDYINAAKLLGTRVLRIWSGKIGSAVCDKCSKDRFFVECKKLAEIAEKEDVILCTEFHMGTYTDTADSTLELLNSISSSHFRTYWQPNQCISVEENASWAKKVADHTEIIHVFNWCFDNKCSLWEGVGAWKKYLSFFDKNKYALLEFMPDGKIESLKTESDALRSILEE